MYAQYGGQWVYLLHQIIQIFFCVYKAIFSYKVAKYDEKACYKLIPNFKTA